MSGTNLAAPVVTDVSWPTVDEVPTTMTAVTFREFGDPDVLKSEELATPQPGPGEVLVKVGAVSVGRLLDLVARSGKHPYARFSFPHVLGADHAGTVAAIGEGVTRVAVGDHVGVFQVVLPVEDEFTRSGRGDLSPGLQIIGTHRQGAYAQYSVVPQGSVGVVPAGIDPAQASALVGVGPVAVHQFRLAGGVKAGDRVIVQGATSSLGSTTALLAKHLGATVVVSSRDEAKRAKLRELGFEHVFDAVDENFADRTREAFGGEGATLLVDNLGEPSVWEHGFSALRAGGTVVSSGAFLGHHVPLNLQRLYSMGIRVVGVRTGTPDAVDELWEHAANGFRTAFDRGFALADAPSAHRYVEQNANVGRVVLVP